MSTASATRSRLPAAGLAAIILLQAVWLAWSLAEPLPATGVAAVRRVGLLAHALPAVVPGVRWGDSHLGRAVENLSHWSNLPQRLPILGASLLVGGAALAVGSTLIRAVGLRGLTRPERLALGFGLGAAALGAATLAAGRWVGLDPVAVRVALGGLVVAGLGAEVWAWRRDPGTGPTGPGSRWSIGQMLGFAAVAGPFLVLMGLGAMLPTIEFDALEYHLQAPKEYFLDGRIGFLPHNVYASMPAAVEMLHLLGMEALGDWWLGALAGQELVAWFAPATAVLIAATATRLSGSARAGWFAAIVYLTTPWVFRVGNSPFVEGPLGFFHAALIWAVARSGWFGPGEPASPPSTRSGLLVGLLAGGAMAIKYPALVSAVVPAAAAVGAAAIRGRSARAVAGFALGLGLMVGPTLAKNLVETGNPVYPLGWSVLGGREWDAAREARWRGAHGPRAIRFDLLVGSVLDVAGRSDWQSPAYALLVPLAWLGARGRRAASALAGYAFYLFATWWLLTHRLDRFWLPMLPALAALAGLGADALVARSRLAAGWLAAALALAIGSNLTLCSTELCGPTGWTADLAAAREQAARDGTPALARLDEILPPDARPLVIGQAGTFGLRHRPAYNTVFNPDRFESIARGRPHDAVRRTLRDGGITHVYVDWAEIERYRKPGNYGFTDFETPAVFDALVRSGVLAPGVGVGPSQVLYAIR